MSTIDTSNLLSQSPYFYLQAAGSDGSDGTSPGVHLRWSLAGRLGDLHLPKGNLAASGQPYYTTAGFSKADDFVKVYRREYDIRFPVTVDFTTMTPIEVRSSNKREWHFNGIIPVAGVPSNTRDMIIRFSNILKYESARVMFVGPSDPLGSDLISFLKAYDDIIEAEVDGKTCFSAQLLMAITDPDQEAVTRMETISTSSDGQEEEIFISNRRKFTPDFIEGLIEKEDTDLLDKEDTDHLLLDQSGSLPLKEVLAENMIYVRFKGTNCYPQQVMLQTYDDYMIGINNDVDGWTSLGSFSLSLNDTLVYQRLENPLYYSIHNKWPKFNEGAAVNADNYKSRWIPVGADPGPGLKSAIQAYLERSMDADNLDAFGTVESEKQIPDLSIGPWVIGPEVFVGDSSEVSMLMMLKLASLDFHAARMMGLGHIDNNGLGTDIKKKFVYAAVYNTTVGLEEGDSPSDVTHAYLTLPTGKTDLRLPPAPEIDDIYYGLFADNGTEEPDLLSDENGYSKYGADTRFVNLPLKSLDLSLPMGPFFVPDTEFSYGQNTAPAFFGVEYKRSDEANWRNPEINHEPFYADSKGVFEPSAVVVNPDAPVYRHQENEAGVHRYAMYAINWFSRVSPLSNTVETDETVFVVKNTLLPPLNFTAQLIQPEDLLLFTTEQEQLDIPTEDDNTYVRVTFSWNDANIRNYKDANIAEFFFRQNPPIQVAGKVAATPMKVGTRRYDIRTKSYKLQSTDSTYVTPVIAPGDESKFVGSLFSSGDGKKYVVSSVRQSTVSGEGPVFTVDVIRERNMMDASDDGSGAFTGTDAIVLPETDELFSVVENASVAPDWPVKLNQSVELIKFTADGGTMHEETMKFADGTSKQIVIGGIYSQATITEYLDKGTNGGDLSGSRTGVYSVQFNTYQLADHPDPKVSWYKGTIKLQLPWGETRVLDVWDIDTTGLTLKLIVHDGNFEVDPYYHPINNYIPIPTGDNINVNFHPGYKAYLVAETGFGNSTILPTGEDRKKLTYMSCRSGDTMVPLYSYLAPFVTVLSVKIVPPLPPGQPLGPLYATRPDFYGKATYTFDTEMNTAGNSRLPYALVFYRAEERAILTALYKSETIDAILSDPAIMEDEVHFTDIWNQFVNGEGEYLSLFPNPDNDKYRIPDAKTSRTPIYPFSGGTLPLDSTELVPNTKDIFGGSDNASFNFIVKNTINGSFLPLTEQPVIYQYVKSGYQTSPKKPVIRDTNGDVLLPTDPLFDPFPMAVGYISELSKPMVRFTDYTLDGASKSLYFYYAIEMSDTMALGERSDVCGPIHLVNSMPPAPPQVKKVISQPADPVTGDITAVLFEINDYLESDDISKILIYRAYNMVDALNTRTMVLGQTINYGDPVTDDFSDLDYLPFGETLFYKLVALRKIKNEFGEEEYIPSLPSKQVLTNIIDVFNPPAPDLLITPGSGSTTDLLEDVVIEWEKTTYNGTYYLYQMNDTGNWVKIYEVKTNDATIQYELPDDLVKVDEDDNPLYYRFKVQVENSSGLLNIEDNEKTI